MDDANENIDTWEVTSESFGDNLCDSCNAREAVTTENGTKLCEPCFQEYVVKHK